MRARRTGDASTSRVSRATVPSNSSFLLACDELKRFTRVYGASTGLRLSGEFEVSINPIQRLNNQADVITLFCLLE